MVEGRVYYECTNRTYDIVFPRDTIEGKQGEEDVTLPSLPLYSLGPR